MDAETKAMLETVGALADEYRDRCLWFLREDYRPGTVEEAVRILSHIERHADLTGFRRAATLRQWLSRHSSVPSSDS